jgi:hypothetical protein
VGITNPSRPDFPEQGLSVSSNQSLFTNIAGVSPHVSYSIFAKQNQEKLRMYS